MATAVGEFLKKRLAEDVASQKCVRKNTDFERIEALPRRTEVLDLRKQMTEWLKTPDGTMELFFCQAWALAEFFEWEGTWGWIEPGEGKTGICLLAPTVIQRAWDHKGIKKQVRAGYIVPANLKNEKTLIEDVPHYGKHFEIYDWNENNVISYESLGREKAENLLEERMFNVLILDESHKIKNKNSAVSKRVLRYIEKYPNTIVLTVSGTGMKESIKEIAHVIAISHGDHSPLPLVDGDLDVWASALDHGIEPNMRAQPGALLRLCREGEDYYQGFQRHLAETPGIIIMRETDLNVGLNIFERRLKAPPPKGVGEHVAKMRKTWKTPSDDVIISGLEMARHVKELAAGFYYRWTWPDGRPDTEWLAKRKTWRQCVRRAIQKSGTKAVSYRLLDSEKPVETAVLEGKIKQLKVGDELVDVPEAYREWKEIKDRCDPKKQAVWVDEFLIEEIERWMKESKEPGIVWTDHIAVMNKLRKRGHIVYGGGQNDIVFETKTCVASIDAHKEGKNLQAFGRGLFASCPSSGLVWDQSLARWHRTGQKRDEVSAEVFLHTHELWLAFKNARSESDQIQKLIGTKPRLKRATIVVSTPEEVEKRTQQDPVDPFWVPIS